jgi:hypothetical protein
MNKARLTPESPGVVIVDDASRDSTRAYDTRRIPSPNIARVAMRPPSRLSIETRRRSSRPLTLSRQKSPHDRTAGRRRLALFVVAIVGSTVLAACSGAAAKHPSATTTTASPTTTTTTLGAVAPLTGLPATDPSIAERPAVIIKIDNDAAAPPQSGLDEADVVYEEVVEGGITRYLAIFQSQDAGPVGPVRSVRETDADIVRPIGGLFAYSGGIPPFVSLIDSTGITDVGAEDDGSAYYRSNARNAPDNLYTSTTVLRQRTTAGAAPPPPLFDYVGTHEKFSEPGEEAVSQVTVTMSGATVATWSYDAATRQWDRSTNGHPQTVAVGTALSPGPPVAFTNIIVEMVPYQNTGYIDPDGNPVPDANTVGSGQALILSDGESADATWSKSSPSAITTYQASDGSPIRLLPGTTWVMLAPQGAAITSS